MSFQYLAYYERRKICFCRVLVLPSDITLRLVLLHTYVLNIIINF
jgi:hypothetical protein